MYIRKIEGPRAVTLPDGRIMTRADLPAPGTQRWVASRKLAIVQAVAYGLLPQDEALKRYDLSEEEFALWRKAVERRGAEGLKVTHLQRHRQL
ncbi:MAG: DUF1153 domain-containing protein [Defluviimonas sp.]|uniref:CtrA inhibitor SciP n=1 Tax=Albidovulum sp. TaxID=1872424 RepID=UPI001D3178B7|nr:DUF1153 domain-containing protein [Paracoccaceae bacterium]MCC0063919.1 DUF1153 domain-containing protein [Defluviimonas sp.]